MMRYILVLGTSANITITYVQLNNYYIIKPKKLNFVKQL